MTRLYAAVFLSGSAFMGFEIAASRVLAPVFGTSVFTWGALITVFLASLSVGYAAGGRLADRWPKPELLASILMASGTALWLLMYRPGPVMSWAASTALPERYRSLLACLVLFTPPSILMGIVTPFATRLAARELHSIGQTAGWLAAVSTGGSIVGTFAMTFLLIPEYPLEILLYGSGAVLVLTGALAVPGALHPLRTATALGLTGVSAALFLLTPEPVKVPGAAGKIVFSKQTAYHRILVVDEGLRRKLYFDRLSQGSLRHDGKRDELEYPDAMCLSLTLRPALPKSAVVIGLGTGMIPGLLTRARPEIKVTTIEIDPQVVDVARQYFSFSPDANDTVLVGDGRQKLAELPGTVDAIFSDAFFADSVPYHLTTREFFELCSAKLTPDGVLAGNFIGYMTGRNNELFWAIYRTLREVFPTVYIVSPELARGQMPFRGNAFLIASKAKVRRGTDDLARSAQETARLFDNPNILNWLPFVYTGVIPETPVPILTDSYSPTDALQHFERK
ncbi:MAG: fused MFS/spermidine synthase [Thermoanaerobaculia bacterium]|nr:fused MFS/spermidine synthase [Thermoanaerobaculia bacterium]